MTGTITGIGRNGNYDEWIDEWDGSWDASDLYYYDYLIEAEEYPYYYPASDAEILHDGHGNFTVSGSASGAISSDDPFTTVIQPSTTGSTAASNASGGTGNSTDGYPDIPAMWQGQPVNSTAAGGGSYTSLSIPAGQRFGTLTINGKQIGVYEGTTDSVLLRGAGHFTGTSAWDGNACFAGHNRGPNAWFYDLISLRTGDAITYSTSLGTRTYRVSSIRTVSVNDLSPLNFTDANQLTLVTCLANQPSVRLIVTAVQI